MKNEDMTRLSRFLCFVLRHEPSAIGIEVDSHAWADVRELIDAVNSRTKYSLDMKLLERIVAEDEKMRYSFSDDKKRIKANQGHSFPVDLGLKEAEPPEFLYHGTVERFADSIIENGIVKQTRNHVHLSKDIATAANVGSRRGETYIFKVLAGEMHRQGYTFYLSENGVWLTDFVPPVFLDTVEGESDGDE